MPLLMLVGGVNYFIDPAHFFNFEIENKIAEGVFAQKNITNYPDCNDRKMERILISKFSKPFKTVVFGSSHTMLLTKRNMHSTSFFNSSFAGALTEDLMGVYLLMKQKNILPDTIILCLDAAALNENHGQTRWQEFLPEIKNNCEANNLPLPKTIKKYYPAWFYRLQILFSPDYFQQSLKDFSSKKKSPAIQFTNDSVAINMIKFADGSIRYPNSLIFQKQDEKQKLLHEYLNGKLGLLNNFYELSANYEAWFNWLLDDMQQHHIVVIGLLPAFEPSVYQFLEKNPKGKMVMESEKYFRNLMAKKHLQIIGSYNPLLQNLVDADFYNADHFKEEAVNKIFVGK